MPSVCSTPVGTSLPTDQEHRSRWPASSTVMPTRRPSCDCRAMTSCTRMREADGSFAYAGGPFGSYQRTLTEQPRRRGHRGRRLRAGRAVLRVRLRSPRAAHPSRQPARDKAPWWAPPERLDARAATALGVLAAVGLIVGYLNTLLTQTIAFAADEFGSTDRAQGVSLAIVRCGVLLALVIGGIADRRGRRRLIIGLSIAAPIVAATGALAPSLPWLTASQAIARPLAMALGILIAVVAMEEMPAGSRAYAVSLLAMATALGAGACVASLPLADLGVGGWRLVFVVPLLGLAPRAGREQAAAGEPALRGATRRRRLRGAPRTLLAPCDLGDVAEPVRRPGLGVPEPVPEERAWASPPAASPPSPC